MKKTHYIMEELAAWLVITLRMLIGLAVMKTGFDLAAGRVLNSVSMSSDPITPLFIILVGAYFCFSGLFRKLFNNSQNP